MNQSWQLKDTGSLGENLKILRGNKKGFPVAMNSASQTCKLIVKTKSAPGILTFRLIKFPEDS